MWTLFETTTLQRLHMQCSNAATRQLQVIDKSIVPDPWGNWLVWASNRSSQMESAVPSLYAQPSSTRLHSITDLLLSIPLTCLLRTLHQTAVQTSTSLVAITSSLAASRLSVPLAETSAWSVLDLLWSATFRRYLESMAATPVVCGPEIAAAAAPVKSPAPTFPTPDDLLSYIDIAPRSESTAQRPPTTRSHHFY